MTFIAVLKLGACTGWRRGEPEPEPEPQPEQEPEPQPQPEPLSGHDGAQKHKHHVGLKKGGGAKAMAEVAAAKAAADNAGKADHSQWLYTVKLLDKVKSQRHMLVHYRAKYFTTLKGHEQEAYLQTLLDRPRWVKDTAGACYRAVS